MKLTRAWIPGDDAPEGNWTRWALQRYCYDAEGKVIPAMIDALDRWPLELFEQISGIAAEKSDLAAAWQDFRYTRMQRDRERETAAQSRMPSAPRR